MRGMCLVFRVLLQINLKQLTVSILSPVSPDLISLGPLSGIQYPVSSLHYPLRNPIMPEYSGVETSDRIHGLIFPPVDSILHAAPPRAPDAIRPLSCLGTSHERH